MIYQIVESEFVKNNFWKRFINSTKTEIKDDYYNILLRSNLKMEPKLVTPAARTVFEILNKFDISNINVIEHKKSRFVESANLEQVIADYTNSLPSRWYGDDVMISLILNGSRVCIEPTTDGVDLRISIAGENAEQTHRKLNNAFS